ncbi:MAG: hypothetical protein ACLSDO_07695, partial [Anaerotruncus colihominis]
QYDKLAVPGIFTPTEALQARRLGALMIKVFPVGSVGPQYIRDLLGPLGQLSLMPVGGVTLENAADFFKRALPRSASGPAWSAARSPQSMILMKLHGARKPFRRPPVRAHKINPFA